MLIISICLGYSLILLDRSNILLYIACILAISRAELFLCQVGCLLSNKQGSSLIWVHVLCNIGYQITSADDKTGRQKSFVMIG